MMAVSTMRHLRLSFVIVLIFACARTSRGSEAGVSPKVDPRVELLSIVFRLAGNSEYNMSPLKTYTADIDSYFRSEEHTSELQSRENIVCRLLLEKKKTLFHVLMVCVLVL